MPDRTRTATLVDLWRIASSRRRQRMLRLDPLAALIQPDVVAREGLRARLPLQQRDSFIFVYRERGLVLGWVEARRRARKHDEWVIAALGASDRAPDYIWESLIRQVCEAAGDSGVARVIAQVPKDEPLGIELRALGFTNYTDERIWGNLLFGTAKARPAEPDRRPLRRQNNSDAWDIMQLYTSVTPPAVRRAEEPNTRQWRQDPIPLFSSLGTAERSYVWPDETTTRGGLGGYVRLQSGVRGHWLTLMCRPDHTNRANCPVALDYVLWKAARQGSKPVYCGVREYNIETEILLQERGFHPLSEQELLVKYLVKPLEVRQRSLIPFLVPNREMAVTGDRWSTVREN